MDPPRRHSRAQTQDSPGSPALGRAVTIQGLVGGPSPLSRIATGKGDKQRSVTADAVRSRAVDAGQ